MKKVILVAVMFAFAAPAFADSKVGPQTKLDCDQIKQLVDKQKQAVQTQDENHNETPVKKAQ